MTFQRSIIVVFFMFYSCLLFAQNKQYNELDKTYAPPMMLTAGSTETESINGSQFPNVIKFNPSLLPLGHIALFYERYLFDDVFSIGVGLGFSPYKNVIRASIGEKSWYSFASSELIINYIYKNAEVTDRFNNIFLSGYAKINFEGFMLDLGYVEIGYRYFKTNLLLNNSNQIPLDKNSYQTYISNSTLHLLWGETLRTDGKKANTYHDFYIGIGIGMSYSEKFIKNNSSFNSNTYYSRDSGQRKERELIFRIGYIFGIGLK